MSAPTARDIYSASQQNIDGVMLSPSVISLIIRSIVTLALLAWIASKVDLNSVIHLLKAAAPAWIAAAVVTQFIRMPIGSIRWQKILMFHGLKVSIWELTRLNFIAAFFSQAMPTVAGGDLIKGVLLYRSGVPPSKTVASIVFDRASGVAASIILAGVVTLALENKASEWDILFSVIWIGSAFILFLPSVANLMLKMLTKADRRSSWPWLKRIINPSRDLLAYCSGGWIFLAKIFFLSVAFQAGGIFLTYLLACSIGISAPMKAYFIFLPIVWVLTMIPLSISGIGIREAAMVWLFSGPGGCMSRDEAIAVSIAIWLFGVFTGIVGGAIYLAGDCEKNLQ